MRRRRCKSNDDSTEKLKIDFHLQSNGGDAYADILVGWSPIGHTQRIFSLAGLLLVTHRGYSRWLVSYWSHAENILIDASAGPSAMNAIGNTKVSVVCIVDGFVGSIDHG
jgi:hypothetical protein